MTKLKAKKALRDKIHFGHLTLGSEDALSELLERGR